MVRKKEKLTVDVKVRFTPSQIAAIDRIAEKLMLNRSQIIRNLASSALDDAKLLERLGILKAVGMVRATKRK